MQIFYNFRVVQEKNNFKKQQGPFIKETRKDNSLILAHAMEKKTNIIEREKKSHN